MTPQEGRDRRMVGAQKHRRLLEGRAPRFRRSGQVLEELQRRFLLTTRHRPTVDQLQGTVQHVEELRAQGARYLSCNY